MDSLYKPSIVTQVQSAIGAMNEIVAVLARDAPLASDIMDISYPEGTVETYLRYSQEVVEVSTI